VIGPSSNPGSAALPFRLPGVEDADDVGGAVARDGRADSDSDDGEVVKVADELGSSEESSEERDRERSDDDDEEEDDEVDAPEGDSMRDDGSEVSWRPSRMACLSLVGRTASATSAWCSWQDQLPSARDSPPSPRTKEPVSLYLGISLLSPPLQRLEDLLLPPDVGVTKRCRPVGKWTMSGPLTKAKAKKEEG